MVITERLLFRILPWDRDVTSLVGLLCSAMFEDWSVVRAWR